MQKYYISFHETLQSGADEVATRAESRERILNNIEAIVSGMDELDQTIANIRRHAAMNDAFFLFHRQELLRDLRYGSEEDLVELYLDTCQILGRMQTARTQLEHACRNLHYYNYKSCILFTEAEEWHGKYL